MNTDPRLKPLGELRHLDLITSDEYDDTLAELEIIELQRAHNAEEDIDVPELAMTADQVTTLAWLLSMELVDTDRFLKMLHALPAQEPRWRLASAALHQVNRKAIDTLYGENLINQFQRDAAHDSLPAAYLAASPVAALRHMLKQGTVSPPQYEQLKTRTRANGSQLARVIVDAAGKPPRPVGRPRPRLSTVLYAVLLLAFLTMLTFAGRAWFASPAPVSAIKPVVTVETVERGDLQQRAADMVEGARQPGADGVQYDIQVIQDKPPQ